MLINFDYNSPIADFTKIDFPKDCFNPYVCVINLSAGEISSFIKSKIPEEDKAKIKNKNFYPIAMRQNRDFSFEITFGLLE